YLNTPQFGMSHKIHSVKQALVLIGEQNLRKWASLVAVTCLSDGKTPELMHATLVRARFCELCAEAAGLGPLKFELFLAGMLSTLDAMLDYPMESLLKDLPVFDPLKDALLGAENPIGCTLRLAQGSERGDFDAITRFS